MLNKFFINSSLAVACFHSAQEKKFLYSKPIYIKKQQKSFKFKKVDVKSQKAEFEGVNILWNCPFDKGRLKSFVSWFLINYGEQKTIELLEQLKKIGFGWATKAGISLGIDDLKIPPQKFTLLSQAEFKVAKGIEKYKKGKITGVERLQLFIDVWNQTSEFLKQEVVKYFEKTDLFNPVYMMAFSGARGNLSQVRQLVGMRGLMSDPQGNIIDFPIQSNFREGLTLTEYIISTYGARKGIVDTALRTATAGYLTRRLVDVAQHVMISQFDCGTARGIFVFDMKDANKTIYSFQNRLIGRVLARDIIFLDSTSLTSSKKIAKRNQEVSSTLATAIAKITKKAFVRSPLTCETRQLVCQLCYGWSLSNNRLVSLGEAVGVIAAQSIGEPGTQLTMRTFHTGGVFSGGATNQIIAPYDGYVEYVDPIPGNCVRSPQGDIAFLTKAPGSFLLIEKIFKKKTEFHTVPGYAMLFFKNKQQFVEKEIVAQFSNVELQQRGRGKAEQMVYANLEGQISLYQIDLLEQFHKEKLLEDIVWRAIDWSKIWILSGKNYVDPLGLTSFSQKGDFINKNSIFQKIYWYPLNSSYIEQTNDFYGVTKAATNNFGFLKIKKREFPNQLNKKIYDMVGETQVKRSWTWLASGLAPGELCHATRQAQKLATTSPGIAGRSAAGCSAGVAGFATPATGDFVSRQMNSLDGQYVETKHKNFYQSMYKQAFVSFSNKQMHLKNSLKNVKNINLKSILFVKKDKKYMKKINSYRNLRFSYLKIRYKYDFFFLLKQNFSNFYFYPFKTKIFLGSAAKKIKKMQRLDFISNRVFMAWLAPGVVRQATRQPSKKLKFLKNKNFNVNFFNIKSFFPNYLIKKSVKKKKLLKFSSLNILSPATEQKKKFFYFPIKDGVHNKSIFYLNSTSFLVLQHKSFSNKLPYFTKQNSSSMLLKKPSQINKNFVKKKESSFIIKRPLLNLSIQKITFKKLGYIFSIKRNFKSKISLKKFDKIFSFFPFMQKEVFSMNNFNLNDPGKNAQSLSLGNSLQWSPFPTIGFRWFPFESYTNASGIFICGWRMAWWSKPRSQAGGSHAIKPLSVSGINFLTGEQKMSTLPHNPLNQTKDVLNEKIQELKNAFFIEKKRWIFTEGLLKKFQKKELSNFNLFQMNFSFKRKKNIKRIKKSWNSFQKSKLQLRMNNILNATNKFKHPKIKKTMNFYQREANLQFIKKKKTLQFRYLSSSAAKNLSGLFTTKNKVFGTKKQQNKISKFSVYKKDFYFIPQDNFKGLLWNKLNNNLPSNNNFSKSDIFLTNRQGFKKQLKIQISGLKRIYKKNQKIQRFPCSAETDSFKQRKTKFFLKKKKTANKNHERFLLSCFSPKPFKNLNSIKKRKILLTSSTQAKGSMQQGRNRKKKILTSPSKFHLVTSVNGQSLSKARSSKTKKSNSILQLFIRNQMFNNLKNKLILKSRKNKLKNLKKYLNSNSLITKLKNQSLFFSSLPIKNLKKDFILNSSKNHFSGLFATQQHLGKEKYQILKKSLLNDTQVEGVTKPGWVYFLLDFDIDNYYINLDPNVEKNLLKSHTNSNDFHLTTIEKPELVIKRNENCNSNLEFEDLKKFVYIKNLNKKFVYPGKKVFQDLCFEQNEIFIENLLIDDKKSFETKGNFTQVFKNNKARFLKTINQKNQNFIKSFSGLFTMSAKPSGSEQPTQHSKIALLLRPVQYKILQSAQIYKTQLYQLNKNLQDECISLCFYSNYHSKLLNQQNCQNKILSNFPALGIEVQQTVFFFDKSKKKKKNRKKEINLNKSSISLKNKNHPTFAEFKTFYSAYQGAFFSLMLKNSKEFKRLNFAFHMPIFNLNSPFQKYKGKKSSFFFATPSPLMQSQQNSSNFLTKNQDLSFSLYNKKSKIIYNLLEKNQFRGEILMARLAGSTMPHHPLPSVWHMLSTKSYSLKSGSNDPTSKDPKSRVLAINTLIARERNLLNFTSPFVFEWCLGKKEGYLINQKFGISSFFGQSKETNKNFKFLFANSSKSSISRQKRKAMEHKKQKNRLVSYPRIKNSFLLYKENFILSNSQVFAATNLYSPFEGELLTNCSDSIDWWNNLGDTLITNQTKNIKNSIFLTKKDIFSILFFPPAKKQVPLLIDPPNLDQKNTLLKSKTENSSSFNDIFASFFKNKKQQSQKKLFENYLNFILMLKQENQLTKNSYKIHSFFTKYQNKIYHLKGLSLGKPADKKSFPYSLGNYLLRGDPVFLQKKMDKNGQIIHFNLKKVTLRHAQPFLISPKGMLHVNQGDFIYKNAPILTLPFETLTTGDIVQGIPKVEQYLEARTTQNGRFFLYSLPVLLKAIFERYRNKLPLEQAVAQSFLKIQQIIVDGVQRVYRSQGVSIAEKHLEVIVKQMTSKVQIIHGGQTGFFPGELVDLEIVENVNKFLMVKIRYEPVVLGITRASLEVESFLSAASFQQTTKILAKASLSKKKDYLKGLKENLLVGNLIPAGTGFMNSFKANSFEEKIGGKQTSV